MMRLVLVVLLAATWAVTISGGQTGAVRSDQEILVQLERDWDAAFRRRDVKFIDSILAEEFVATYGDGTRGDRDEDEYGGLTQHVIGRSVGRGGSLCT